MKRFWTAFLSTCDGLAWAMRNEVALAQELAVLVVSIPVVFFITSSGWLRIALVGTLMLLTIVELLNTAIEKLCDHVSPAFSPQVKVVKDLGSAAVFVAFLLALVAWLFALWVRIF